MLRKCTDRQAAQAQGVSDDADEVGEGAADPVVEALVLDVVRGDAHAHKHAHTNKRTLT